MASKKKEKTVSCSFEELNALGLQPLKIGDQVIGQVVPRHFASGSYGLSFTGKYLLPLPGGKYAELQCAANFTVIGSKEAAEKAAAAAGESAA